MEESKRKEVEKRGIFNENGDIDLAKRKIIQGNTTNLNDFNNLKYTWTSDWYRQAMNNFCDSRRSKFKPRYKRL